MENTYFTPRTTPVALRRPPSTRDDTGRPPLELCILKGLDEVYIGRSPGLNARLLHLLRGTEVSRYIRARDFEETRRIPRGRLVLNTKRCARLSMDFDSARPFILEYAREYGVAIDETPVDYFLPYIAHKPAGVPR